MFNEVFTTTHPNLFYLFMRLHFRLDTRDHDGLRYILLDIRHQSKRIRVSTKLAIPPKSWNPNNERLYPKAPNADVNNKVLEKILIEANNVYGNCLLTGTPFEPELIRQHLKASTKPNVPETLETVFDDYIASQEKNGVRAGSITIYRTTLRHVQEFDQAQRKKDARKKPLTFADMDADFFDDFLSHLLSHGFVNATAAKYVKSFKSFLYWAVEKRGIAVHPAHKFRMAFQLKTDSDHIALTENELHALETLQTGADTRIAKARDLFLLQCYTGLRYSDAVRLTTQNIYGSEIKIETVKTRQSLTIPLHSNVLPILQRNGGSAPKLSNQRANEYLKEACKRAGLTDTVTRTAYRGAKRSETTLPKHEIIGTHTGRRTFVTMMLQRGISGASIRRATGHRDTKSFDKYVRLTNSTMGWEFTERYPDRFEAKRPDAAVLS
jgi:site-specific recombinase XerD